MSKYIPDINNITDYADDVFERKKSGGTGKAILSFFLGIIIGLVGFFGGIFAAGKLVLSQKVGDTVDQIDGFVAEDLHSLVFGVDAEHSGFINAAYAERTLEELFGDLGKAAGDIVGGRGTINSLNAILPIISDKVVAITDGLTDAIGIPVDNETLMDTPLSGIGNFFLDTLQTAKAGDILTKFAEGELNSLMMYFCYGEEGTDYDIDEETGKPVMRPGHENKAITIQGLFGADFTAQLQNIPLANIIGDVSSDDHIMLELLYGSENRYTKDSEGKITMNQVVYTLSTDGAKFINDKDEEVATVPTAENGVYTITVGEETQYVKFVDGKYLVYTDAACSDPLLYKKTTLKTINNVGDIIDGIHLEDFIDPGNSAILNAIVYETVVDENGDPVLDADGNETKIPRKVSDLTEDMDGIIGGLYLKDVIEVDGTLLEEIAYKKNSDGTKTPVKIGDLSDEADDLINDIALDKFITPGDNAILNAIVYTDEVDSEGNRISRTLGELKDTTIMNGIIDGIKLCDVIDTGDNTILDAIVYVDGNTDNPRTLGDLKDGEEMNSVIDNLKLSTILDPEGNAPNVLKSIIYDENGVSRKLSDLTGSDAEDIINSIKLVDALGITTTSPSILKAIAYKEDGTTSRTLGDLSGDNATNIINGLKLSDVITEDRNNEIIMFLLHGKKGVTYTIVGDQIIYAQRRVAILENKLYDQYGEEILGATLNGTTSYTLNDKTYYLQLESDNIYKVYSDSACTIEVKYGPTTIGDMSGSSNPINNITKVLTLQEIMGDDVSNNTFLKHLADKTIDELPTALNNLTIQQVFEDQVYTSSGELNGVWHYLLINPETGLEEDYKLTDMNTLMSNMVDNVHDASLYNLKSDGIVEFEGDTLDKSIVFDIYDPQPDDDNATQSKQKIGHLSVNELLDYFTAVLNTSSSLSGS